MIPASITPIDRPLQPVPIFGIAIPACRQAGFHRFGFYSSGLAKLKNLFYFRSSPKLIAMKISTIVLVCCLSFPVFSLAQDFEVPANLPSTKEEFVNSEKDLIAAAKWLETTPVGTDMDKRTRVNAYVIAWLTNSPTVTIEIKGSILKPFEKNPQLLSVFMGGFSRYCLENNYSKDQLQCNIAGLKSVINCYNLGGDIKKDKALTKLIDADKDGKLEDWVKDAMNSK